MFQQQKRTLLGAAAALALIVPTSASAVISAFAFDTTAPLSIGNSVATMTGTVACTFGETVSINITIAQVSGRSLKLGSGSFEDDCDFGTIVWEVAVPTQLSTWKKGPADAIIQVQTRDAQNVLTDQQDLNVRIRLTNH